MGSFYSEHFQLPSVLVGEPYEFSYTPIAIKYVQPVVSESTYSLQESLPLRLIIKSPVSKLPGYTQALPTTSSLVIPVNGILKLSLVPSNLYGPKGFYSVRLVEKGNRIPISESLWEVPNKPCPVTISVSRTESDTDFVYGIGYGELISVSVSGFTKEPGSYSIAEDRLEWLSDAPALGTVYSVTYQPALSLSDVVVNKIL